MIMETVTLRFFSPFSVPRDEWGLPRGRKEEQLLGPLCHPESWPPDWLLHHASPHNVFRTDSDWVGPCQREASGIARQTLGLKPLAWGLSIHEASWQRQFFTNWRRLPAHIQMSAVSKRFCPRKNLPWDSLGSASNRLPTFSIGDSGTEMPPSCRTHLPFPSGHLHLSFSLGGSTERCCIFYNVKMKPVVMVWLKISGLGFGACDSECVCPGLRVTPSWHEFSCFYKEKTEDKNPPPFFFLPVCSVNSSLKETGILSSWGRRSPWVTRN